MNPRFCDEGTHLERFGAVFLVRCPRCHGKAQVVPLDPEQAASFGRRRVSCPACGYASDSAGITFTTGRETDWYFGLSLWLQAPRCGKILWAYNPEHLAFLEGYLRASLREREPNMNHSLVSSLPPWLKQAKHRKAALRCLARLRTTL